MSTFKVLKEPVFYKDRLYQPGDTLEARKDEDMAGFVQAGYVEKASSSKKSTKRK